MFAVSPNSQPQTSATPREISLLLGNISESSVRRVLKDDFGLKPIRRINAHHLTAAQKANRVVRCREWRHMRAGNPLAHQDTIFRDEKARVSGYQFKTLLLFVAVYTQTAYITCKLCFIHSTRATQAHHRQQSTAATGSTIWWTGESNLCWLSGSADYGLGRILIRRQTTVGLLARQRTSERTLVQRASFGRRRSSVVGRKRSGSYTLHIHGGRLTSSLGALDANDKTRMQHCCACTENVA